MKKYQKYIYAGLVVFLIIGVAGSYFYYGKKSLNNNSDQKEEKSNTDSGSTGKNQVAEKTDDTPQTVETQQTKPSTTTTSVPTALGTLSEVSLTVNVALEASVAMDGSTSIPTGSLIPVFYMPSGVYTIQKQVAGSWKDIITAQNYPGHGGQTAWFAGPGEDNISYRVLRIESGQPKSVSKTFVVKRSDLTSGIHTYN